jgi:hypothetical protein
MASRSSAGIGVGITITLLGVACLGLFITTIVFLSKYQSAQRNFTDLNRDTELYATTSERSSDVVQRFKTAASGNHQSVVGYLNDSLRQTMNAASGSAGDTFEQLKARVDQIQGATGQNLIGVITSRDAEIADWKTKFESADKARQTALTDLGNEQKRVQELQAAHQKTIDALNADLDRYRTEVETFRQATDDHKKFMNQEIEKIRSASDATEAQLKEQLKGSSNENLQLKERLGQLQREKTHDILKPRAEESLVDGTIIGLNQGANEVTIGRGTNDKIVLGMTFAVYSDATAIKPDASGNYPRPKAKLEVIRMADTSSTCRITEETRGNPVVRGDVIANAVYDPNKVYTLLVFGNFDANGDGIATPAEAEDIKTLIKSWGGKVTDELTGNVDFLVLGQRPQLPPPPGPGTPLPLVQEYIRLDGIVQQYNQFLQQAVSTSVPVLNESRLYTLIGRKMGR